MSIEIGKVYHVKKFEDLPEKFPTCGLERDSYRDYLCDTIVTVRRGGIYANPNWGTFYRCVSCDPRKNWKYSFCINESLLEEIPDEKTAQWTGYFAYLKEWMEEHKGVEFYGMSPASFDEWFDEWEENEYEEA